MSKFLFYLMSFFVILFINTYIYLFTSIYTPLDNILRDKMFLIRGEIPTTKKVVIVDIDEKSLSKFGQWPWSRDIISQIIVNITNDNASVIGLDMFFAEKDMKSPYYISQKYGLKLPKKDNINYDEIFAYVLSQSPTIMGYFFNLENNMTKNQLPNIPAIFIQKNMTKDFLIQAKGYIANIPILQNNAYSAGFVNAIPDSDGVVRSVPLLLKYNYMIYPSLAFEMYRAYKGIKKVIINYSDVGIDNIQLGKQTIKTDRFGRLFVNYRGDKGTFKYISAKDVYENRFKKGFFKDKFVLIGTTATGLFDLRVTPFNSVYPGVEVHANILDQLLKNDFIFRPDFAEVIDLISLIVVAIIVAIGFYFLSPLLSIIFMFFMIFGFYSLEYYFMFYKGYIFNIDLPILEIIILGVVFSAINYFLEIKNTKNLKNLFSKKVSKNVMNELIHNTNNEILSPKEKEITIFFSDIRSFTSISEKLHDPKKVIELLNLYMTPMVEKITLHKGTIDKFIGDAIMAYWNAPISVQNHADEAVSSAIEQIKLLKDINKILKEKFDLTIQIGIGINSGIATIGEMGSKGRADYTIIGDNVNLASRLESLNKIYHSNVIISSYTLEKLSNDYIIRELDLVRVKGKEKPVNIYEVIGFGKKDFSEYNHALSLYREAKFKEAKQIFESLYKKTQDYLYKLYIDRCEYFIQNNIQIFDGVWNFDMK